MKTSSEQGPVRPTNVFGGSGEATRGSWCTPKWLAEAVGPFDLDPFSNARSWIRSAWSCRLERGENGIADPAVPGSYWLAGESEMQVATADIRTWIQPPYEIVPQALAHYGHTRFCFLLRFDPSTRWFRKLYRLSSLVIALSDRVDFEPPPGVPASSNPFPHALFYRDATDATPAILRRGFAWRTR